MPSPRFAVWLAAALAAPAAAWAVEVPPEHPVADFNGDYESDVAIGVPSEEVGGVYYAGAVNVLYGGAGGLSAEGNQLVTQAGAVYGAPQTGAMFGAALAAGDFDGDFYDDLAIGAPYYDEVDGLVDAGLVVILYGSPDGLAPRDGSFLFPFAPGARYGSALAAGAFDQVLGDDLAVGAPGWTPPSGAPSEAGMVEVLYATRFGFRAQGLWEGGPAVEQTPREGDRFGSALAAGDFDDDLRDDLAIGVPGKRVRRATGAGLVHVLYGAAAGFDTERLRQQTWSQASRGVASSPETGDAFGAVLAAGDLDHDYHDDLAVGAPTEGDDRCPRTCERSGLAQVLFGGEHGLARAGAHVLRPPWGWLPQEFRFAHALAIGDLDGDGYGDLAVGAPGWRPEGGDATGMVHVAFGSADGIDDARASDVPSPFPQAGALYGDALSTPDVGGDWIADLVVGAPGYDVPMKHGLLRAEDAGAAVEIPGAEGVGPAGAFARLWAQGELSSEDVLGTSEEGDLFGLTLAP